jgi:beta-lactamase regulating signal transducer with metallopeptidase domain
LLENAMSLSSFMSLEFIIRLTLILSVVLVATAAVRRRYPVIAATAQDFVLVGLVALPIFTVCGLSIPWHVSPPQGNAGQSLEEPAAGARIKLVSTIENPPRPDLVASDDDRRGAKAAVLDSQPKSPAPIDRSEPDLNTPRTSTAPPTIKRARIAVFTAWNAMAIVYVGGLLLLLTRIGTGLTRLRRLLDQSSPVNASQWLLDLSRWQRAIGLNCPVRLVRSDTVTTPMTLTWKNAVVLIPSQLENAATPEQRNAAILHELVHIQRSDFRWQLFLRVVEAFYWFHPFLWLLSRSMTATRELVCDAVCARQLGAPRYANTLIELTAALRKSSLPTVGLAMARSSRLRKRLVSLHRVSPTGRSGPTGVQVAAIATLIGLLVVGTGVLSPVRAVAQPAPSAVPQAQARPESKVHGALGDQNSSKPVARSARVLDPNGKPVAKAVVNVIAVAGKPSADNLMPETLNERVETDASGRFTVSVPANREFGLIVRSEAGAIARLVVPEGTDILADIQLARGVAVSGRVLTRNGQPLAGCVVSLKSNDDQSLRTELTLGSQELKIKAYQIADVEGRFRFSPVLGDFLIHLVPRGQAFRADSAEFRKAVDPPPFVPVMLRLDKPGEKSITLIEAPTAQVSGTIRSDDGKPSAGVTLRLSMPPHGGNAYVNLGQTKTDQEGRYSVRTPIPLEHLVITTDGQFGADGQPLQIRPLDPMVWSARSQFGMLMIDQVDGDRTGLDCVFVPAGRPPANAARAEAAKGVSPDLLALERAIKNARDAYVQAQSTAQTQEQKDAAYDLFPSKSLIDRCMVIEAKHRGSRTAFGAMHWIMRMAAMNADNPATAARERLIMVLRDHYTKNADVDLLIDEFPHGDTPLEAETLLRTIAAESPHDYVRATALYELAQVLLSQVYLYEIYKGASYDKNFDAMIAMQQSERTRRWMLAEKNKVEQLRSAYRKRDMKAMTSEAERLFDQVVTQFSDVRAPERRWDGPEDLRLVDFSGEPVFRRPTLAERADNKRFQMTNLRLDQPAPILEGTDYFHKRIRLSDFAGKVVVLTVTMDTVGARDMYSRCAQLLKQYSGQPVACLSVVPTDGSGGYSVRDIVRQCGITWPIIRDTRGDRLAQRWCQQTFHEAYVIDARGVIRFHEVGPDSVSSSLTHKVEELLKAAPAP